VRRTGITQHTRRRDAARTRRGPGSRASPSIPAT
jgi:hypothetical protein